jgi:hypothetical protein
MIIGDRTGAAGLGLIGGVFEGLLGRQAKNDQMAGDWAFQNFLALQQAENNRMGLNASLGSNLSSNRYSNVVGPDLDRLRQRESKFDMANIFLPKEEALKRESARWSIGASLDPSSREAGVQAWYNKNREANANANIGMQGMFGKTSNYIPT